MKLLVALVLLVSCAHSVKKRPTPSESIPEATDTLGPVGKFKTSLTLKWAKDLVATANCLKERPELYQRIKTSKFTETSKTPEQIADDVKAMTSELKTYTYWNPFSNVIATTYSNDKENIYFNTRKNPRSMKEMVNTIFHETTHLIGYTHSSNYNNETTRKTVPYMVGQIAEDLAYLCE